MKTVSRGLDRGTLALLSSLDTIFATQKSLGNRSIHIKPSAPPRLCVKIQKISLFIEPSIEAEKLRLEFLKNLSARSLREPKLFFRFIEETPDAALLELFFFQ